MARRQGFTITETLIATLLLGITIAIIGTFSSTLARGLRDRELSARIGSEITSLREVIGSWKTEEITVENIEAIPVVKAIGKRMANARWQAQVAQIEEPIEGLAVTISLVAEYEGQAIQPEKLRFWVAKSATESTDG